MSITDWLRTGTTPMDQDNRTAQHFQTDAEFAAMAAATALTEGRYELGRALAALAARAAQIEATALPRPITAAREEQPGHTADVYAHGPTGNGDQDLLDAVDDEEIGRRIDAAARDGFNARATAANPPTLHLAAPPPPTARCWYTLPSGYPCELQAFMDRSTGAWHHIDPDIAHDPLINGS